jgi:peptidoglycan/xylan/chitin deacetylase (PgdA/CDA1 family)
MYHGLHAGEVDPLVNFDGMYLHVDRFERQMRYLARHYGVIPLERCRDLDRHPLRVVVTFDDGYASIYRYAYPVLKSLGLPATVFVSTDFVERRTLMWWDRLRLAIRAARDTAVTVWCAGQRERFAMDSPAAKVVSLDRLHALLRPAPARERDRVLEQLDGGAPVGADRSLHEALTLEQMLEMVDHGVSFQSHGVSHVALGALSDEQLASELRDSKTTLERWFAQPVTWFAYPFGERDPRAPRALAGAGYEGAVSCRASGTTTGSRCRESPSAIRSRCRSSSRR